MIRQGVEGMRLLGINIDCMIVTVIMWLWIIIVFFLSFFLSFFPPLV
jgi:hypothetical protein